MASVEACYKAMSASPLQPQNTADDATLLDRYLKTGDKTQLGILFRQHADSAYRIALRVCGNSADAEDAVQAAFLQVLQRAPQYRGNSTVRGWIMSIVINCCRMEHRKDSQRRRREEEHASQAALSVDGGDEVSQNSELASAAISVVKGLPEHYRMPVWLHYVEGLSFQETAGALAAKEKTVREQARRGIEQVRQTLAAAGLAASLTVLPEVLAATKLPLAPVALKASLETLALSSATKSGMGVAVGKGGAAVAGKGAAAAASTNFVTMGAFVLAATAVVAVSSTFLGSSSTPKTVTPIPEKAVPSARPVPAVPVAPPQPKVVASFDFETVPDPDHFSGVRSARPEGGSEGNRFCMKSEGGADVEAVNWHDWDHPLFISTRREVIEFDYYLTAAAPWACCTLLNGHIGYDIHLDPTLVGRWKHVESQLREASRTEHTSEMLPAGLPIHCVMIQCPTGHGRKIYVDNLKITTVPVDSNAGGEQPPKSKP